MKAFVISMIFSVVSCSTPRSPVFEEVAVRGWSLEAAPPGMASQRLAELTQAQPAWQAATADAAMILRAQSMTATHETQQALGAWEQALLVAKPELQAYVLDKWLTVAYAYWQGQGHMQQGFADYVAQFLAMHPQLGGLGFPPMVEGKPMAISEALGQRFGFAPDGASQYMIKSSNALLALFEQDCPPASLPLAWQGEGTALHHDRLIRAVELKCQGNFARAFVLVKREVDHAQHKKLPVTWLIKLLEASVDLARAAGERKNVAWGYTALVEARRRWPASDLQGRLAWVRDLAWAARYNALLGHQALAKKMLGDGEREVLRLLRRTDLSSGQRGQLEVYLAEMTHVLCFRLLAEESRFEKAMKLSQAAARRPGLPMVWRQRLLWFSGLYAYAAHDLDQAHQHWSSVLATQPRSTARAKLLFWLSRLAYQKGRPLEGQELLQKLHREFPEDYYAVVAPRIAKLPLQQDFTTRLPQRTPLRLHGAKFRYLEAIQPLQDLRVKVELLMAAGAYDLARLVAKKLARDMRALSHKELGPDYLYLAKLMAVMGELPSSVSSTRRALAFYDQDVVVHTQALSILYPVPHRPLYRQISQKTGVPEPVLYAISRQESLFNPRAESPMSAYGLMQLILPTARRFGDKDLQPEQLYEPETNLLLGARYLNFLKSHFGDQKHMVFAAYNAGEFVADIWQQKRRQKDLALEIEMIPFSETRRYIQNVWRNQLVYTIILSTLDQQKR